MKKNKVFLRICCYHFLLVIVIVIMLVYKDVIYVNNVIYLKFMVIKKNAVNYP